MNNAILNFPVPANEPVKAYLEGSPERIALDAELERQWNTVLDIPIIIGGKEIRTGNTGTVVCPHDHKHVLATFPTRSGPRPLGPPAPPSSSRWPSSSLRSTVPS